MSGINESITICDDDIDLLRVNGVIYADGDLFGSKIEIKFKR